MVRETKEWLADNLNLPLPWVVFIVLQTAAGFWWAASMESRVHAIETTGSPGVAILAANVSALQARISLMEGVSTQVGINSNRLTRIETELERIDRLEKIR